MKSHNTRIRDSTQHTIDIELKQQTKLDGRFYTLNKRSNALECIFGCLCESANEYEIAQSDPNFAVGNKKGSMYEQSDCVSRIVCACNRPMHIRMKIHSDQFALSSRECRCCLDFVPFYQNQMTVMNSSGRVLGVLKVPSGCFYGKMSKCADLYLEIYNEETNDILFFVEGSYCQKGIQFPCLRCFDCPNVQYTIYDNLFKKVGKISNLFNGCLSLFSRSNKYGIEMPLKAQFQHKILLMYAAIYMDYLKYDTPYCYFGLR